MTTNRETWTATHTHFDNGNSAKVYTLGRLSVTQARNLETGAEGWVFLYEGLFSTETHRGFRTMAEAKAAATAYASGR